MKRERRYFEAIKEVKHLFPHRKTDILLQDFFQTDVDDFTSGKFQFLSVKKVKVKTNKELDKLVVSTATYGYLVKTFCYNNNFYYNIFVCEYKPKPWMNNYHIRGYLSSCNNGDGYSVHDSIEEFGEWCRDGAALYQKLYN